MARVLMVSSEAAPFAKTGGLADVLGALPKALLTHGHRVAVCLPRYRGVSLNGPTRVHQNLLAHLGSRGFSLDVWAHELEGVTFYFLDCPPLFDRPGIYSANGSDFPDNHLRFAALCHGVLGVLRFLFSADILHLHDWQAALCAPYLRTRFQLDPSFFHLKIVFTIHNLEHQGRFGPHEFGELGLDAWLRQPQFLGHNGDVNLMKGGILFPDAITTVSPRYAQEIQTPEYGFGLDGLIREYAARLTGILNGADYSEWNPETDRYLVANYSAVNLHGKRLCKRDLLAELGLPDENLARPLLGIVSRFARQKGLHLFADIAWELMNEDICLCVVGSGDPDTEDFFRNLASAFPGRVAGFIGYNDPLAHKVEAGADIFLMPSLFEPCGLNQIYSLRYGTIPVVRATGGLDDTVDHETGFKFWGYWSRDFLLAIRAALDEFRNGPEEWERRIRTAMARDFSWNASAAKYSELYAGLLDD